MKTTNAVKTTEQLFQEEKQQVIDQVKSLKSNEGYISQSIIQKNSQKALKAIHSYKMVNEANKQLNLNFHINTDIFMKAIDHCLSAKPLDPEELMEYFTEILKVENYISKFSEVMDLDLYFCDPELEFILLGMDFKKYSALPENSKAHLCTYYSEMRYLFYNLLETNPENAISEAEDSVKVFLHGYNLLLP